MASAADACRRARRSNERMAELEAARRERHDEKVRALRVLEHVRFHPKRWRALELGTRGNAHELRRSIARSEIDGRGRSAGRFAQHGTELFGRRAAARAVDELGDS